MVTALTSTIDRLNLMIGKLLDILQTLIYNLNILKSISVSIKILGALLYCFPWGCDMKLSQENVPGGIIRVRLKSPEIDP
jgi:hypothetical protein